MGIAKYHSVVTMPETDKPYPSIAEFLFKRFPAISAQQWTQRIREGKVLDDGGSAIDAHTKYAPAKRLFYFREIENEPVIPFAEQILFQDAQILVACKPHFLPVTPGGRYVEECLLNRLRAKTGIADLAPLHRLDRATAGVVLFSVNPSTRGVYHDLFVRGKIAKIYQALAPVNMPPPQNQWLVENRMVRGEPRFKMKIVSGAVNARSRVQLLDIKDKRGLFRLQPLTGKTHQLRLHMSGLGFAIVNDRVYPDLQAARDDDFTQPLQLVAAQIQFVDPISGQNREFTSARKLLW
ncbi:MAG: pseudouridine synthase [Gammaproteobacteria bacterium]|nr:pseudouridine synthase [Gammaproteobacteria bacterium]